MTPGKPPPVDGDQLLLPGWRPLQTVRGDRARANALVTPPRPPRAVGKIARVTRPMTDDDRILARALGRCSLGADQFARRFVRLTVARADLPDGQITEPGAAALRRLAIKYRRQLPPHVVALAVVSSSPKQESP